MTIELVEYRCPNCGHLIGEEEYVHVKNEFNKIIQDKLKEQIDEISGKVRRKIV